MPDPPLFTPINRPVPPAPPAPPAPLVGFVSQGSSAVPTEAELLNLLRAIKTPDAAAFRDAYAAFGRPALFTQRLLAALAAAPFPGDPGGGLKPFLIHLARLGAEAFVLDVDAMTDKALLLGYINHPDSLTNGGPSQQEQFLVFAVRRLIERSSSRLTLDERRRQMDKAILLFRFFHAELSRTFRLAISGEADLVAYSKSMFTVMERHYQALLDGLFITGRSDFKQAVRLLDGHLRATVATDLRFKTPLEVSLFRIDGKKFRDYFEPAGASDFAFSFYSRNSPPLTGDENPILLHSVIRKRNDQLLLLNELSPGPHSGVPPRSAGRIGLRQSEPGPSMPDAPQIHDNVSWQNWVRRMWDTALAAKPTIGLPERTETVGDQTVTLPARPGKLEHICEFISRYFNTFTVHVPYDLAEGCTERNYLTRAYPRAITGCLTHDCVVYAARWIFMLGRLFASRGAPEVLGNPRISLVEMPAHVGVMIRAQLSTVGRDVLIAAHNQDAVAKELAANADDETALEEVAIEMYPGLRTPVVKRDVTANPTDATALWSQICKMTSSQLTLPFPDPSEPYVTYLTFNAERAAIGEALALRLGDRWRALEEALEALGPQGKSQTVLARELRQYVDDIEPFFTTALRQLERDVEPLFGAIDNDVEAHLDRIPKDAVIVWPDRVDPKWKTNIGRYKAALARAEKSVDLSEVDPERFFPEEGFPRDVR